MNNVAASNGDHSNSSPELLIDACAMMFREIEQLQAEMAAVSQQEAQMDAVLEKQKQQLAEKDLAIAFCEGIVEDKQWQINRCVASACALEKTVFKRHEQLQQVAGHLACYEEIYQSLVDEITTIDAPSRYALMNPRVRHNTMRDAEQSFLRSGRFLHVPDMRFSPLVQAA